MFLKKIGKKNFAIRRKKAFFLDFHSQALLIAKDIWAHPVFVVGFSDLTVLN